VSLVTPEGPAFEGEAEMIVVPGAAGEIGVLARHAPLVAMLNAGSTRVYVDMDSSQIQTFATGPGFFQVLEDRAIAHWEQWLGQDRRVRAEPRPLTAGQDHCTSSHPYARR